MPLSVLVIEATCSAAAKTVQAHGPSYFERQAKACGGVYTSAKGTVTASLHWFNFSVTNSDEFCAFLAATTRAKYTSVVLLDPPSTVTPVGTPAECGACGHTQVDRVHQCTCSFRTCTWCAVNRC